MQSLTSEPLFLSYTDWHAGGALEDHKDAIESRETADVAITETGAVVTVPTPDILEQSERFAEKEAILEGDLDTSLAQVLSMMTVISYLCQPQQAGQMFDLETVPCKHALQNRHLSSHSAMVDYH